MKTSSYTTSQDKQFFVHLVWMQRKQPKALKVLLKLLVVPPPPIYMYIGHVHAQLYASELYVYR